MGDPQTINKFSSLLSDLILNNIPHVYDSIIYTIDRQGEGFHKNSYLLAKKVADRLQIPLYHGRYYFKYNAQSFYDNTAKDERKNNPTFLHESDTFPRDKTIIIIDDLIYSGKTLESIVPALLEYSSDLQFFSIVDLTQEQCYTEQQMNSFIIKEKGIDILIEIINADGYIFTTQMLRSIGELDTLQKKILQEKINAKTFNTLLIAYAQYHETEFMCEE